MGAWLRFAGFELDQQRAELRRPDGRQIKLRPKTLEMLQLFAANAGRVLSKHELMEAVWPNIHVGEDSLFQCIRELRAALGDDRRQMIRVGSGRGYVFDIEASTEPADVAAETEAVSPAMTASVEPASMPIAVEQAKPRWPFGLRGERWRRARGIMRGRRVCGSGADLQTGPQLRAITADRSRDADRRRER